jgi:hypothetical protein
VLKGRQHICEGGRLAKTTQLERMVEFWRTPEGTARHGDFDYYPNILGFRVQVWGRESLYTC